VSAFVQPLTLAYLGLIAVLVGLWLRRRESGRWLLATTVCVAALVMASMPAIVYPLVGSLEWQYPPDDTRPNEAQAIVVLDAGIRFPDRTRRRAELDLDSMRRCVHAAELYHQGNSCPVVVTGGAIDPGGSGVVVADVLGEFLQRLGVKPADILFERTSRSTRENARECGALLADHRIDRIVLVTDATHLPRAVGCFRKEGFQVYPSGCYYLATEWRWNVSAFVPNPSAAQSFRAVCHEWIGMGWYAVRDSWD
jgi:uncharacterized SAM-binding protein YcdF (DUF218 family)